ncbi:hypothetical protein I6F65_19095 [Pseudoalteromonas sp. SWXJZ94C]|uniref:hypothetical protein n=1 Tax=unclassified Pseudoalteromonas TaxID=194690 RepID=UPI0004652892|nr:MULTISPECIES: hypothetical protein [unclassified Pseudoalteromonas]MBH0059051.1 hypothetical protein [Pseudoalteromonas sp. SWXJZ94C]
MCLKFNYSNSADISKINSLEQLQSVGSFDDYLVKKNPYQTLLNTQYYDFLNMSLNEFKNIINVIINLESDIRTKKYGSYARVDPFGYQLNKVANAIKNTRFVGKLNICDYFFKITASTNQMKLDGFDSSTEVHTNLSSIYETVAQLTSELGFKAIQRKAKFHLGQ